MFSKSVLSFGIPSGADCSWKQAPQKADLRAPCFGRIHGKRSSFLGHFLVSRSVGRSQECAFGPDKGSCGGAATSVQAVVKRSPKRLKYAAAGNRKNGDLVYLELDPSGVDATRLPLIAAMIKNGAVGVIPTDTVYAIVCDLKNREAVERVYRLKKMDPKKPLSILCRSFQDIDTYTLGFPRGNGYGQTNAFRAARQCLPGPYTFILKASKDMPKQCTTFGGSLAAQCAPRKSVGVRMPNDAICQALLQQLDEPLLCTSMTQQAEDEWLLDPAVIAQSYDSLDINERVDFVVDGGVRIADPSTVIDMTGDLPVILRQGKGVLEDWMLDPADTLVGVNPYARR